MQPFEHSETLGKIAGALIALQSEITAVEKTGFNKFDKYEYLTEEGMIFALRPLLEKHRITFLKSTPVVESLPNRETKKGGTEYACRVVMGGMLLHESGEWIKVYSVGEGQDRADKGVYCALTGASKYLMAKAFGFPTGDDPESNETVGTTEGKQQQPPKKQGGNGSSQQSQSSGKGTIDERIAAARKLLGEQTFVSILTSEEHSVDELEMMTDDTKLKLLGIMQEAYRASVDARFDETKNNNLAALKKDMRP